MSDPFALVRKDASGVRIAALNAAARHCGVHEDMRLADARALLPTLITRPDDEAANTRELHQLADWFLRYTPIVAIDESDPASFAASRGLWLDITGAAHLFGGEDALLADMSSRLTRIGFAHRIGLAETPGAAWAVARFGLAEKRTTRNVVQGQLDKALAPLSLEALRLEDHTLYLLKRFGLRTIGSVRGIPRASLKRRFPSEQVCEAVLNRLDQAFGHVREPIVPLRSEPAYLERLTFADPIVATESFHLGLRELLAGMSKRMEKDRKGATRLTFVACHADGGLSRVTVATARPSRDAKHLTLLFRDRIEKINPGFGVDLLLLCADTVELLEAEQMALAATDPVQHDTVIQLIDRLSNRLGTGNVQRIHLHESHIPERAENRKPALEPPSVDTQLPAKPPRPFRLLEQPEPLQVTAMIPEGPPRQFTWRRVIHRVVRVEGPERIAPEWWVPAQSKRQRTRDYYRVEDQDGRRFWMFREGLYGASENSAPPTWHMHGVYA